MTDKKDKIYELFDRLDVIWNRQNVFNKQINDLREELTQVCHIKT